MRVGWPNRGPASGGCSGGLGKKKIILGNYNLLFLIYFFLNFLTIN
jgi:hypothetical protein